MRAVCIITDWRLNPLTDKQRLDGSVAKLVRNLTFISYILFTMHNNQPTSNSPADRYLVALQNAVW